MQSFVKTICAVCYLNLFFIKCTNSVFNFCIVHIRLYNCTLYITYKIMQTEFMTQHIIKENSARYTNTYTFRIDVFVIAFWPMFTSINVNIINITRLRLLFLRWQQWFIILVPRFFCVHIEHNQSAWRRTVLPRHGLHQQNHLQLHAFNMSIFRTLRHILQWAFTRT